MKLEDAVFRICPTLKGFIEAADFETLHNFKWIVANGFGAVFGKYLRRADDSTIKTFFDDFSRVDTEALLRHRELVSRADEARAYKPSDLKPVPLASLQNLRKTFRGDREAGKKAFASGSVAGVAFSGGAATRFKEGIDGVMGALPRVPERLKNGVDAGAPKGCFPIGPVEGLNFFEMFFAQALETGMRCERLPGCLLMTSGVTDAATRAWLTGADLWGMPAEAVTVFRQGENPRLDDAGDILVSKSGRIVWTGDGHGGVYAALRKMQNSGENLYRDLVVSGVRHIVEFNIDNAAARPFFPQRIGRHIRAGSAFTLSTVKKTDWAEKIGVACLDSESGRVEVIEYNSLPSSVAKKRIGGELKFGAGHISVNVLDMMFLRTDLEPTIYKKKSVTVDGIKYLTSSMEFLNQHLTRKLDPESLVFYEVARDDFFIPTKNPTGADSVVTTFYALSGMFGRWLAEGGACISIKNGTPGAFIELHPSVAMDEQDVVRAGIGRGWMIEDGAAVYLSGKLSRGHGHAFSGKNAAFRAGSTFIVRVKRPYGNVQFDPATRKIRADAAGCGKFFIGNGITVNPGVKIEIDVEGDGECVISDEKVFDADMRLIVRPGERVTL